MLGVKSSRESIKAPFAQQMRDSLRRANTGKLSERELSVIERERMLDKMFTSHWQ